MTNNQARVLNSIESYFRRNGMAPTQAEIMSETGIPKSSLRHVLSTLDDSGYIEWERDKHRGISLPRQAEYNRLASLKETARSELARSNLNTEQQLIHCLMNLDEVRGEARAKINEFLFSGGNVLPTYDDFIAGIKELAKIALLCGVNLDLFIMEPEPVKCEEEGCEEERNVA